MGRASLKKQFQFAIDSCFAPGADKHSYKRQNNNSKIKIFSYETLRYYYKMSAQFAQYVKYNNPEIKYIREITATDLQEYINSKKDVWSNITMINAKSAFKILQAMCNQYYKKYNFNFIDGVKFKSNKAQKIRDEWMDKEILERFITYRKEKGCTSPALLGLEIAAAFGLRVSEVCTLKGKDINLRFSNLHIHQSKGKRSRDLPINTPKKIILCEYIKANFKEEDRIVNVREDSVNQYLRRGLLAMNIKRFAKAKTGVHAIRKMVATQEYNRLLEKGLNNFQAETKVSQSLGHNKKRTEITNAYIQK